MSILVVIVGIVAVVAIVAIFFGRQLHLARGGVQIGECLGDTVITKQCHPVSPQPTM